MKFEKGHTKKGGRKAGTPNRTNTEFKKLLGETIEEDYKAFRNHLHSLDSFQFVQAYLKLMGFYVAKPSNNLKVDFSKLSEEEAAEVINQIVTQVRNEK